VLGWFASLFFVMRRNQRQVVDGLFMLKAFALLCSVFATVFFWLIFGSAGWLYILFKAQESIYVMMPSETYWEFQLLLVLTFIAKVIHLIDLLHTQTQHDIFFIDWEQPRTGPDKRAESDEETNVVPVSAWRSVFVANEWVKLQGQRTISVELTLLLLLFILRGLEWERYATLIPQEKGEEGVPPHFLLRFALSSFVIIAISAGQGFVRWAFWDRFVKDRIWQFVDLLAVTNVSAVFLEERYYGYYLHGKSVHAHADADMLQLNYNLKREEDGLVAKRGLEADSDIQTFEVHITRGVREKYDEAFAGGSTRSRDAQNRQQLAQGKRRGFRSAPEELLRKRQEVNQFFISFIDRNLAQERLSVREKHYFEKLISMPPEMAYNTNTSLFLEDPAGRFRRIMLAGREYDLVLLNVLTYALFDMAYTNTFVAIFFTYAFDLLIRVVRAELAVRNIARKTFIDPRFLL